MRNEFLEECLILLKREDIKQNIKEFISPILNPIISILIKEINPYIYLSLIFVIISFLLHLGIFILLIRNKSFS